MKALPFRLFTRCLRKGFLLIFLMLNFCIANAQEKTTKIGIQIKPVFASKFFGTGPQSISDSSYVYTISQGPAFSAGLMIRKGYTKTLSLEFGINYVRRSYNIAATGSLGPAKTDLKIIGYEIPVSQLVFIRLSKNIFMNASGGFCINMFPTDVIKLNSDIAVYAGRRLVFNPSLIANIGFEYRTEKKGYFYIGSSLNRPFSSIYFMTIDYLNSSGNVLNNIQTELKGTYLTVDFRYFFHENPDKKKRKK